MSVKADLAGDRPQKIAPKPPIAPHLQLSVETDTDIFVNSRESQFLLSYFFILFDHFGAVPVLRSAKAKRRYAGCDGADLWPTR